MNSLARGVWPTMITPYNQNNTIDIGAVSAMVDWYAEKGCHGIFAVCQSSEMFFLSLKERVILGSTVVRAAAGRMDVIVSGHISTGVDSQLDELKAMRDTGAKAVVLVTNRLADIEVSEAVWIQNIATILNSMEETTFGLYECPYPTKRLLSEAELSWCAGTGRFAFLKDTCCNTKLIRDRLAWMHKGAADGEMSLYNANSATLLESLHDGAAGFSGIMANLHPDLYVWLWTHFQTHPEVAQSLQNQLTLLSLLEGQGYPICAKAHFAREGIPMSLAARSLPAESYGEAQQNILGQAMAVEAAVREWLAQTGIT